MSRGRVLTDLELLACLLLLFFLKRVLYVCLLFSFFSMSLCAIYWGVVSFCIIIGVVLYYSPEIPYSTVSQCIPYSISGC